MTRRAALVAAAAFVAAAGGIGAGLWRDRRRSDDSEDPPPAAIDVWSLGFAGIEGNTVTMAALRGRPLVLNFWATWCGPCVIEMPLLDRFARERAKDGWQVLALAVDQPDPVRRFLAERTLRLPIAVAGATGLELSRQLGNGNGGLPFTAVFASSGASVRRHLGAVDANLLSDWASQIR